MQISPANAAEILYNAILGLVKGTGPLSQRLRYAWIDGLCRLTADGFPWHDLREPLRDILDYFQPNSNQGRLIIEGLPEEDQRRIAGEIFDLYVKVDRREQESLASPGKRKSGPS
jgi:hypothetical protein